MKWFKFVFLAVVSTLVADSFSQNAREISPQPLKADKYFLMNAIDSSNCFGGGWRMPFCLRALNNMFRYVSGRDVHLLLDTQLDKNWQPLKLNNGSAYYRRGHLVAAKMTEAGVNALNELTLKHYSHVLEYRRLMDQRFKSMARGTIEPKDLQQAFDFILKQAKSEQEFKDLTALYFSAEVAESTGDPYASVWFGPANRAEVSEPSTLLWVNDKFRVARVRPLSQRDKDGLYTGVTLESLNGKTPTPDTINALFDEYKKAPNATAVFTGVRGERWEVKYLNAPAQAGVHHYEFQVYGRKLSVLEIHSFSVADICKKSRQAIAEINKTDSQGLIIDLRGNGGGSLDSLKCVAGLVFGKDVLMGWEVLIPESFDYQNMRKSREDVVEMKTTADKVLKEMAVSFLINARTGSASEIFAGLGKFGFDNVWITGQRSFGKGIGQNTTGALVRKQDVADLNLTSTYMRVHLPNADTYHLRGIDPDFPVLSPLLGVNEELFVERFGDIYGLAFAPNPTTKKPWRSPSRAKLKAQIKSCVKRLEPHEILDVQVWRWMQDQQLKQAAQVTACQIDPNLN